MTGSPYQVFFTGRRNTVTEADSKGLYCLFAVIDALRVNIWIAIPAHPGSINTVCSGSFNVVDSKFTAEERHSTLDSTVSVAVSQKLE